MQEVLDEQRLADKATAKAAAAGHLKRGVKPGTKRTKRPARPIPPSGLADDEVMMTGPETCTFFGGPGRPLHLATLYRGMADGRYPRPVWIGPNSVRWLLSECRKARQEMIDARDKAA